MGVSNQIKAFLNSLKRAGVSTDISHHWLPTSNKRLMVYLVTDKDPIGYLYYKNKEFCFKYESNKKIEGLEPFKSIDLHPFFETRIPNENRANISEKFKECKNDPIEILGELGGCSALSQYKFKAEKLKA